METFDKNNIRSFYGRKSAVWYAPYGTTHPTGVEAVPGAGYKLIGALTRKGVGRNIESEEQTENIWQGDEEFEQTSSAKFVIDLEMLEHSRNAFEAASGAPIVEVTEGVYSQEWDAGQQNPLMEWVVDGYHRDVLHRWVFTGRAKVDGEQRMEAGKATFIPLKVTTSTSKMKSITNDPNWDTTPSE